MCAREEMRTDDCLMTVHLRTTNKVNVIKNKVFLHSSESDINSPDVFMKAPHFDVNAKQLF